MFVFTLIFYLFLFIMNRVAEKQPEVRELKKEAALAKEEVKQKEKSFEENIKKQPMLIGSLVLMFLLVFSAGLGLNFYFLNVKLRGFPLIQGSVPAAAPPWGLKEALWLLVILFFFEALILCLETAVSSFVSLKGVNKDLLLIVNSLIRNVAVAGVVLGWVRWRFGKTLESVGLTTHQFWKNVKRGILGYLAIVPWLFASLLATSLLMKLFSYEPEPQVVVQIYLKNSSDKYLLFFTLFVALVGPAIEEIFFRGFAYTAFRNRWGVRSAMFGSAAVFAALHMNLVAFVPVFMLGVFLAYLYEKTGSLVSSVAVHMTHNFIMVSLTMLFKGIAS